MQYVVQVPPRKSILTLPFRLLWRIATAIEKSVGILVLLVTGIVLMIVGLVLSATYLFAVVGIPLFIVGIMLTARAIY